MAVLVGGSVRSVLVTYSDGATDVMVVVIEVATVSAGYRRHGPGGYCSIVCAACGGDLVIVAVRTCYHSHVPGCARQEDATQDPGDIIYPCVTGQRGER